MSARAWDSDLLAALSRVRQSLLLEKIDYLKQNQCHRCPASMSPRIYQVAFPETMSRAGGLMLNCCQEVPVEMPPLGVQGHLALH